MNDWLDEAFETMRNPFTYLAIAAIAYVLIRLIVAAVTGH